MSSLSTLKSLSLFFSLVACFGLNAQAQPVLSAKQAERITARYYQSLLGVQPRLAELQWFATRLPKGADLHHHFSGAMYGETYLDWIEQKGLCIMKQGEAKLKLRQYQIADPAKLSAEDKDLCVSVSAIKNDMAFYRAILQQWSKLDFSNHVHLQVPPDQHFFNTFAYFPYMDAQDFARGLQLLKQRAQAEHVSYIETMLKGAPTHDEAQYNQQLNALAGSQDATLIQSELEQAWNTLQNQTDFQKKIGDYSAMISKVAEGIDDASFSLRFQGYVARGQAPARVFSGLYSAFIAAHQNPLLVGVNIVGPEHGSIALRDYFLHMQMFAFLKKKLPQTQLALHAGELTIGLVRPEDLNGHIRQAVEIAGAKRIGHGIDIAHENDAQQLLNTMRQSRIAVEINLTSNDFILGVKDQAHPILLYRRFGVPIVIATDDAGVSRNNLSGEYALYMSRYQPDYRQLKQTVMNSLRYSFLPEALKQQRLAYLQQQFAQFEQELARLPKTP